MTTWPSIDHSLLSPSGRMSGRARKAALARETERLFGGENLITMADLHKAYLASIQPTKAENLRRSAANLRDLAARGMKVRAYPKMAAVMEAEADRLEGTA